MVVKKCCFRLLCVVLLAVATSGVLLHGQEEQPKQDRGAASAGTSGPTVRKVIRVRHIDVGQLPHLFFQWGSVQASEELGLLSVSGSQEQVDAIEQALREFDVPEENQAARGTIVKTFQLPSALDPQEFGQIYNTITGVVDSKGTFPMMSTNTVAVRGTPEQLRSVEEVINDFNRVRAQRAPRNIELTVYLLGVGDGVQSSIPEGVLQQVVSELKKTMPYQEYRLLETLTVRTRIGENAEMKGVLPQSFKPPTAPEGEAGLPAEYKFAALASGVSSADNASVIKFQFITLDAQIPVSNGSYRAVAIRTAVDVPDGKTVVIGKAGAQGSIQALFLVLTAKVVD